MIYETHRVSKLLTVVLSLSGFILLTAETGAPDIQAHKKGIWSIQGSDKEQRWIVIHNLVEGRKTGIYHIEVIQRAAGAPAWQIKHLANHMAITEDALKRSVLKPLDRGAVYPEAFDDALAKWTAQNDGKGGDVCRTTVLDCISK